MNARQVIIHRHKQVKHLSNHISFIRESRIGLMQNGCTMVLVISQIFTTLPQTRNIQQKFADPS
jgi:hypothetical protein